MDLAPVCIPPGTRGPLRESVALPGTLARLAVLRVGVHVGLSPPPSHAWGAQGLVWGGGCKSTVSCSWRVPPTAALLDVCAQTVPSLLPPH